MWIMLAGLALTILWVVALEGVHVMRKCDARLDNYLEVVDVGYTSARIYIRWQVSRAEVPKHKRRNKENGRHLRLGSWGLALRRTAGDDC
jgi:hypothetical protein